MEQDLFKWLNETHNYEGQEKGLLLAPFHDNAEQAEQIDTAEKILLVPEIIDTPEPAEPLPPEVQNEPETLEPSPEVEAPVPLASTSEPLKLWAFINGSSVNNDEEEEETYTLPQPEPHQQPKEWQEEHTGFSLSLDEPPSELWTRINSPTEDDDDDDEEEEYEQGMSLQGAAYIPKQPRHGTNFTQRLQRTLQGRKERAARMREDEEEQTPNHPYIRKAMIMCTVLMATLILSWVCLWFMQDGIAAYLDRARAEQKQEQEKQSAIIIPVTSVREEPLLPPVQSVEPEPKEPEPVIIPITPKPQPQPAVKTKSIQTFDEALTEANNAYNIGMYSNAVLNFHRALALRGNDIRPYIGLAASYRAKGMYFDAKRLLDEASTKFGRNPAIDMERYYLRRELQ